MPLLAADHAQLELRIAANVWRDAKFIEAVKTGDMHATTAEMVAATCGLDLPPDEMRVLAKNANFGAIYQSGGKQIAEQTGQSLDVVERFLQGQKDTFSVFFSLIEDTKRLVARQAYLRSISGRKRSFYCDSPDKRFANGQIREAVNWMVQGPAAEVVYLNQICLDVWLNDNYSTSSQPPLFVMNEHDKLVLDVTSDDLPDVAGALKIIMENPPTKDQWGWTSVVPFEVDMKVGPSLGDLVDYVIPE